MVRINDIILKEFWVDIISESNKNRMNYFSRHKLNRCQSHGINQQYCNIKGDWISVHTALSALNTNRSFHSYRKMSIYSERSIINKSLKQSVISKQDLGIKNK